MKQLLADLYRFIFLRKSLQKVNAHLYKLVLRGIGILNAESYAITGEDFFLKFLKEENEISTVVDVGANIGDYSAHARLFIPQAKIYALEPHPQTFKKLQLSATKNNFMAFNFGLDVKKGIKSLWDYSTTSQKKSLQPDSALSSIYKDVVEGLHEQKAQAFKCKFTTLDEFCMKEKIQSIDLLKIDTEGNEYQVLLGAKKTLAANKIRCVQFEFNEMNVFSRTFFRDFMMLLPNYKFFRLMPWGLMDLGTYRPLTHEIFGFQNVVAILNK